MSVSWGRGLSAAMIAERRPLPHSVYRASTLGAMRALGLEFVPDDQDEYHGLVVFGNEPGEHEWARVDAAFGEVVANPYASRRGR
jgi:hypothetical protein